MKRGLTKVFFMVKGTKKRLAKKRGIKHYASNGMVTNPVVSAAYLSQNSTQMGPTENNEELNEP